MSLEIRRATIKDRATFLGLWKEFMLEQEKLGSPVRVTDDNLRLYANLFESYEIGSLFGACLLAYQKDRPVGLILAGEQPPGGLPLETKYGKSATLWGVYVQPEYRRQGIAKKLQDAGPTVLRTMGFKTLFSSLIYGSEIATANALSWGVRPVETIIYCPLDERK
jgi:GNAT superfamily N-acetyltransferase